MAETVLTVIGARPQFVKAAPVSQALREAGLREILVHSDQHYDSAMSDIFFKQLDIPAPQYHLGIGSGSHGVQTGEGLKRLEPILEKEQPDLVLVYGDTNTTLAGALSAAKLHFPVAHVEAGLRSFNRQMPEEINRVLTDHLSTLLFTPTPTATENLKREGITQGVYQTGDVMLDAALIYVSQAESEMATFFAQHRIDSKDYILLTMHRAETTSQPDKILTVLQALEEWGKPVLFPIHPRTRKVMEPYLGDNFRQIRFIEPLGYFDMLMAEKHALKIVTDSGGVQKEAAFFKVPCITLREETEWLETVEAGWNTLVGLDPQRLLECLSSFQPPRKDMLAAYGNGQARYAIVEAITKAFNTTLPERNPASLSI